MLRHLSFVWVLTACFTTVATAAEPLIWVEGEQAVKKQLVDNAGLNDVNPDELSGGKWLCSFSHEKEPTGTGEYAVEIPEAGRYHLWVRAVGGTGLAYRVDGAKDAVDVAIGKGQDPIPVSADGNPFYPPTASWYDLGTAELTQGNHTITWYLGGLKGKDRPLTQPSPPGGEGRVRGRHGLLRADLRAPSPPTASTSPARNRRSQFPLSNQARRGTKVPQPDKFDSPAVLDLSYLNEKVAGEHGFIRLSKDGNSFVRGDGEPVRFWASGERTAPDQKLETLQRQARFLAKRGMNALRIFAMLPPSAKDSKITDVNEKELDSVFKVVAAMKSAGIYTIIDGYKPASWRWL